jgi:RNA polymerase sigma factor (sigma-70 family)
MVETQESEEHLFRREAGRLVSILTGLFGMHNLALAEDVVQDAFCRALETWKFHGVPENPSAWLLTTARNRALDVLRRDSTALKYAPDLEQYLKSEWTLRPTVDEAFDAGGIKDVQLRMMFSCVHPELPEETQLALILHLLCGFGMEETAAAFLKKRDALERKLRRAKLALAKSTELFELKGAGDVAARLPAVQRAIYLLFNEGYHGASPEAPIRRELCAEAMRLIELLLSNRLTATPSTHALAALANFLYARLPSRLDSDGNLLLLIEQDRSRWDANLIAEGRRQMELSASGDRLSAYHIEAAIAERHASAKGLDDTDWDAIVSLYTTLMKLRPSPVVALNRAVAIAQREGPAKGLEELEAIPDRDRLKQYPFFFTAIGEFQLSLGHPAEARKAFETALRLARNPAEKQFLTARVHRCSGVIPNPVAPLERKPR